MTPVEDGQRVSAPSNRQSEHALYKGGSLVALQSLAKNAFSQRLTTIRLLDVRGEGKALSQRQALYGTLAPSRALTNRSSGNCQKAPS
jgi:hypothetical protein